MNQAVSFGLLFGGGILLTSALTDSSIADVLTGKAGKVPTKGSALSVAGVGSAVTDAASTVGASSSTGTNASLSGGVTPQSFAQALLQSLGKPISSQNVAAIVAWEKQEGGNWNNPAKYNPLNTTQQEPGSITLTGSAQGHIQAYTSWQQGLDATVATLHNGDYQPILDALTSGSTSVGAFGQAVGSTPWGTGAFS
jgi:hypothetical protein